jgi:hypothetical protein
MPSVLNQPFLPSTYGLPASIELTVKATVFVIRAVLEPELELVGRDAPHSMGKLPVLLGPDHQSTVGLRHGLLL